MKKSKNGYFHLENVYRNLKITVGEAIVKESSEEKLLVVTIDKNLNFKSHVSNLCKRASQKLHALSRVSAFMNPDKLLLLILQFLMIEIYKTKKNLNPCFMSEIFEARDVCLFLFSICFEWACQDF